MTAPLPRGYVRLTLALRRRPIVYAASAIRCFFPILDADRTTHSPPHIEAQTWIRTSTDGRDIDDEVIESQAEVQAALVAALGAQDGDDDLTVAYMSGSASKSDEIARLKTELANMTAAAEVAARAHDAAQAELAEERKACDKARSAIRRSAEGGHFAQRALGDWCAAHDARRAAQAPKPEGSPS